ncbi:MAG TPA: hypothetical protein VHM01_11140 [Alphaproteobacteria bacterium]|nr:hypothetical protein [Alphaproteobacteria bacterium]
MKMRAWLIAILLAWPLATAAQTFSKFEFVALGDMPYRLPDDYARFDRLIAAINALKPAFSIHVGDIKSGGSPCTDANFQKVLDQFATFEQPLVYTPGDNEWTDCHRAQAGGFDPLERLARVRQMFFADPSHSLGRGKMPVESQALAMSDTYAKYVENARFERNGVLFATVHVVGSNNSFEPGKPETAMEHFERDAANVAWIDDTFRKARETNAKALVLAWQADVQDIQQKWPTMPRASGFVRTVQAVERGARAFNRPVLVVYGDAHEFEVARFRDTSRKPVPNVLALQVMGESRVHAVRVLVDPDSPGVFGFVPLIVPENGPH